jgi:hypothetical protein
MPLELTQSREIARLDQFITPDGRGEFPTSNFQQLLDDAITTQLTDRSYVIQPSQLLTARDDGSVAAIDVATFVVHWPDIPKVSYQAATIGNLSFSTAYTIYFLDSDRDGTPDSCFFATTDALNLLEASGILVLGTITTPADGGGDVTVVDSIGGGGVGGGDSTGDLNSALLEVENS